MVPHDLGAYTVPPPHKCKGYSKFTDDVRRRDVPPPTWVYQHQGPADVTYLAEREGQLGELDLRPKQAVQTEQGVICLGTGPLLSNTWMPTVADLKQAPYLDTRRTGISDRYYR